MRDRTCRKSGVEGGRKGVKCRPAFGARVRRGGRGDYKPRKTIAASVIE